MWITKSAPANTPQLDRESKVSCELWLPTLSAFRRAIYINDYLASLNGIDSLMKSRNACGKFELWVCGCSL